MSVPGGLSLADGEGDGQAVVRDLDYVMQFVVRDGSE